MNNWTLENSPRKWQEEALSLWKENLRGIVKVVTGGGKTFFAEMCILEFKKLYPSGKVIVIVPTLALLDQWYLSLQDDLNVSIHEISIYSGQEKSNAINAINLMVINTARKLILELSQNEDVFLIVDECHHAGSPENARALNGKPRATLGLSATPKRDYDDGLIKLVEPKLGSVIFSYDYEDASKDGIITGFELINVKIDFLREEQVKYNLLTRKIASRWAKRNQTNKPTEEEDKSLKILLQRRAMIVNSAGMRIPVAVNLSEIGNGKRTLIFHERIMAADTILRILKSRGHNATIYHSQINPVIRRDNLALYKTGVFDYLVTCKALDEGLNVPETCVAIIASATASDRQRIQRFGRVLRPTLNKVFSTIYTVYVSDQEELRLIREAAKYQGIVNVKWKHVKRRQNG